MKILAIERELPGASSGQFKEHLAGEAAEVWRLYQASVIRELYFRADRNTAILVLECEDVTQAGEMLAALPLVQAGLISFELLPLKPYSGFARLFACETATGKEV